MAFIAFDWHGNPERQRIRIAVLVSIFVHLCTLPWQLGSRVFQESLPGTLLTVRIMHAPQTPISIPAATLPGPEASSEEQAKENPLPDAPKPPAEPASSPQQYRAENLPQSTAMEKELIVPAESSSVDPQPIPEIPLEMQQPVEDPEIPASASQAAVLLLIGTRGEVLQIVWGQLPAISDATLEQMEKSLREKRHPPSDKPYTKRVVIAIPK